MTTLQKKLLLINSELAAVEGYLMGMHEGIDMSHNELNLDNISKSLLEQSKKLTKIGKEIEKLYE